MVLLYSISHPFSAYIIKSTFLVPILPHFHLFGNSSWRTLVRPISHTYVTSLTLKNTISGISNFAMAEVTTVKTGGETALEKRINYSLEDIMHIIATMGASMLNIFHWHITVYHSFPLLLPSELNLSAVISYDLDMQYSPKDVNKIVDFTMSHDICVMPDIYNPDSS